MRLTLLFFVALAVPLAAAQTVRQSVEARAEDGRVFLIKPDGTWSLVESLIELEDIPSSQEYLPGSTDPQRPPPPPAPPRIVDSNGGMYSLIYNPNLWVVLAEPLNTNSEFSFEFSNGTAYAIIFHEDVSLPLDVIKGAALENARGILGADVTLIREQDVTNKTILGIRIEYVVTTDDELSFYFINSIFSDEKGTVQLITWVLEGLMPSVKDEFIRFHEGVLFPEMEK